MKSAGKARNNGLYRHIRTSKEIIRNLLNDFIKNSYKPELADSPKEPARTGYAHIAFSTGSREAVDALTARLKADGYEVTSDPRTTGDGYYESCIAAVEGNLIELTV